MARKKKIRFPGQRNLFDYIAEIANKPTEETIADKVSNKLIRYCCDIEHAVWLVFPNKKRDNSVNILTKLKKKELCDRLEEALPDHLFKLISYGPLFSEKEGSLAWYCLSDLMEKRMERISNEYIKANLTLVSQYAPKLLRERTEKYLNGPFNLPLMDAFKKAAAEYKHPSKRLRKALESGNFKEFLPSLYQKQHKETNITSLDVLDRAA